MPGNFERYRVAANKDQLERTGMMSPEWVSNTPAVPNRVHRAYEHLNDAALMYNTLRDLKLVALKNWLS